MRYVEILTNKIVSTAEIREKFPDASIPEDGDLTSIGYKKLIETTPPPPLPGHVVVEGEPVSYYQTWVQQPKPKHMLLNEIDMKRDQELNSGFNFNGNIYHCDAEFQSQLQGFILAYREGVLPPEAKVTIRRKDNVNVEMGLDELKSLAAALLAHVQGIYAESWSKKDAIS